MDEIKQLIKQVMDEAYVISLGTVDDGGVWVSDLVYVHDDELNIYWLSKPDTRRSRAIASNPNVAGSITKTTSRGEQGVGLQVAGVAEKLEGDVAELAEKHHMKTGKSMQEFLGEAYDPGEVWYKLTPKKIELYYEPKFGFEKQTIEL